MANSVVTHRGNAEVPPPMVVIAPSVMCMEYKWSVACHPQVTRFLNNGGSALKRAQIDQIFGYEKNNYS